MMLFLDTGGGSGFGTAIVQRFSKEGAKVLLGDVNAESGQSVASQDPEGIVFLEMDVTKADHWNAAIELPFSMFGRFDIFVNNAGTSHHTKVCCFRSVSFLSVVTNAVLFSVTQPTLEVTEAEWERVFDINVRGVFQSARAAILKWIEKGHGGSIIRISSVGTARPRPGLVWYNASKGAVSNVSPTLLFTQPSSLVLPASKNLD
jgi:NAD(P)-dependent dehydrogenase (short-subunit alcohol dehydrogenase family)